MALFTDGPPSSIDDLAAQDSQLLGMASVEGIDVTQKIALAWDEVGLELYTMLNLSGTTDGMFWQPAQPNLGAVVVTPPLRLWHTFRALQMVYQDAYNSQLNDRYAGKRDYFHKRAVWANERLMEIGVGIAALPVARAGKAVVNPAAAGDGLPLPDGTYFAATAWVNRNGEEGAAGDAVDIALAGSTLSVLPGPPAQNVAAWNVYVGTDAGAMTLQNPSPLDMGHTWIQPAPLTAGGRAAGTGQAASFLRGIARVIQRG